MDALTLIRRLHQHRRWVNRQLLEIARQLPATTLHTSFQIGQGSIWKSLTHLYAAEYVWLEALTGNANPVAPGDVADKLPGNQEGDGAMSSLSDLIQRWQELDLRWTALLDQLTEDELAGAVYKTQSLSGQRSATSTSDILLHVCTHAQYTTAQLVNMLRHAGATTLPDPMLITLARQEMAARDEGSV